MEDFINRAALILIDLQKGFCDPKWGNRGNPFLEENVRKCLLSARKAGLLIAHVRHDSRNPDSPLRSNAPGFAFLTFAIPESDEEVFTKHAHGAFVGTELEGFLRKRGITEPIFLGIAADHCVSTSVRMANDLGFDPFVVSDAIAAFPRRLPNGNWLSAEDTAAAALASLEGEFAKLISTHSLMETIRRQS
jgi:nicotinamidase-related amidase